MKKTYSTILSAISLITLPISLTSCYSLTANNIVEINIFENTIETQIKTISEWFKEDKDLGIIRDEKTIIETFKSKLSYDTFEKYIGMYDFLLDDNTYDLNYSFLDKYSVFSKMNSDDAINFIMINKNTFTYREWGKGFENSLISNDWNWWIQNFKPIQLEKFVNDNATIYQNDFKQFSMILNKNWYTLLDGLNISNINENNIWDYITVQKMPPQPWWIDQKIPPRDQAFQLTFKYKKNNLIYQSISPIYSWWKTA